MKKIKLTLNQKMLLYILSSGILIFAISIGYTSYMAKQNSLTDAMHLTEVYVKQFAQKTEADLNADMNVVRDIASSFKTYYKFPVDERMKYYKEILHNISEDNPDFLSVWVIWELRAIDPAWTKPYGRGRYTWYRDNASLLYKEEKLNTEGDNVESAYYKIKMAKTESVIDPYFFSYTGSKTDQILETSLCIPILYNNEFFGLAGIDLPLGRYYEIIDKIKPFPGSFAYLIANDGTLVGHPQKKFLGMNVAEVMSSEEKQFNIRQQIKAGQPFNYTWRNTENKKDYFVSYTPINIGKTNTSWSFALAVPLDVVLQKARHAFLLSLIVAFFGIVLLSLVIMFIAKKITLPLALTTQTLKILSQGAVDQAQKLNITTRDEIGEMAVSVNTLIEGLSSTAEFARQIGKGNLAAEYHVLSQHDLLGNSLLDMRKSLQHAEEEERKRKIIDQKQNWITQGIARFSDILRQNTHNLEELSYSIISNLVKYLDANQGALFIKNDNNPDEIFYELKAAIAFDRRKMMQKKIQPGEELVGRCAHENYTIYMTAVPDDYVHITSGLGEANPRCILLVPSKINEEVYGVIEIVSFNTLEEYQIEFVEKIGESIASAVSSVKINQRTTQLLQQAQMQREELSSKEEEMRQNLEELQATQEESTRREAEMNGLWSALNAATLVVEFDMNGYILNINDRNLAVVGVSREQMIGRNLSEFAAEAKNNPAEYRRFWDDLKAGKTRSRVFHQVTNKQDIYVSETYTPILDNSGKPNKILSIGIDITKIKLNEIELQEKLKAMEAELEKIRKGNPK